MREHFKDEKEVKKKISDVIFKALTSKTTMTEDELTDEIWEVVDKAEKVMK